uniref:Ubiquitin-like protease family profile domain-containing protein n=1 Tax=Setaria italica TaxID=4555 RepID=K4ALW6_SETIT
MVTLPVTPQEPASVNSSVTPAYQPAPRRELKRTAALQSPLCSKAVCKVYNAVLTSNGPSTRSSNKTSKGIIIINYWDFHITLDELANSIKPNGSYKTPQEGHKASLTTTSICELLFLVLASFFEYLQSGQLDRSEVKRVFRKNTNHLDHRHMVRFFLLPLLFLFFKFCYFAFFFGQFSDSNFKTQVMFPVLQQIEKRDFEKVGHYFLLVLNLRNNRFEVLDSMRTLEDGNLRSCCNTLMDAIKKLWNKHYSDSSIVIENYNIVDIGVPIQTNK